MGIFYPATTVLRVLRRRKIIAHQVLSDLSKLYRKTNSSELRTKTDCSHQRLRPNFVRILAHGSPKGNPRVELKCVYRCPIILALRCSHPQLLLLILLRCNSVHAAYYYYRALGTGVLLAHGVALNPTSGYRKLFFWPEVTKITATSSSLGASAFLRCLLVLPYSPVCADRPAAWQGSSGWNLASLASPRRPARVCETMAEVVTFCHANYHIAV